jgi:5-phospho-D-xylono-1,4-lactonase
VKPNETRQFKSRIYSMTATVQSSGLVRTVLGDIPASALGVCYAHEHIIIDPSYMTEKHPDFRLDSVENAVSELAQFRADGGSAVIDSMPTGGRNAAKLAEVSRRSGVRIVCPTGLHLQKYYPEGHWGERLSATDLTEVFVREIEEGIDANDLSGPEVKRLPQRAGVIKIAGGLDRLSERERKIFQAASRAHLLTGCPILTHTEQGTAALEQVSLLGESGVDLRHVCLSHTDRKPDVEFHRNILRTGVRVEFDSAFRWPPGSTNHTLNLVVSLAPEFPDQIMLGMDAARRGYWKSYGGHPGLSFLLKTFAAQLRDCGLGEDLIKRIFITTPADTFQFSQKVPPKSRNAFAATRQKHADQK